MNAARHATHHAGRDGAALLLASASPRRRELLWQLGVPHRIAAPGLDESLLPGEAADAHALRLAAAKAAAVRARDASLPVLGADTVVVLDGAVLGKPRDEADAARMLAALAGRGHEVLTAVALADATGVALRLSRSEVWFRDIGAAEIAAYIATREPFDKAGAYAIQGLAAAFVRSLHGSHSGVMGLPLFETAGLLDAAGVPRWQPAAAAHGGGA